MPTPRQIRAFYQSRYVFGGETVRVGVRSGLGGVVLTAWNPAARRRPLGWNKRRQRALCERLRRVTVVEGLGGLSGLGHCDWQEAHLLARLDARAGLVLARRFGQSAVLVLRPGQAARLVLTHL